MTEPKKFHPMVLPTLLFTLMSLSSFTESETFRDWIGWESLRKSTLWFRQAEPLHRPQTESATASEPAVSRSGTRVALVAEGGTYLVPVQINGVLTLRFTVDSGAADVTIPADVVMTLYRTGTIRDEDFIGTQKYQLADGSIINSRTFRIRSLTVGTQTLTDVKGSVADVQGSLLLGQSFLSRFRSWAMDNEKHELVLEPK